jgi:acetolactate synthase regulatory subunit
VCDRNFRFGTRSSVCVEKKPPGALNSRVLGPDHRLLNGGRILFRMATVEILQGLSQRWQGMCHHRVHQGGVQRVVVLLQRVLRVVQHQIFQGAVDVVGLSESKTSVRLVDYAVVYSSIAPENIKDMLEKLIEKAF